MVAGLEVMKRLMILSRVLFNIVFGKKNVTVTCMRDMTVARTARPMAQ